MSETDRERETWTDRCSFSSSSGLLLVLLLLYHREHCLLLPTAILTYCAEVLGCLFQFIKVGIRV